MEKSRRTPPSPPALLRLLYMTHTTNDDFDDETGHTDTSVRSAPQNFAIINIYGIVWCSLDFSGCVLFWKYTQVLHILMPAHCTIVQTTTTTTATATYTIHVVYLYMNDDDNEYHYMSKRTTELTGCPGRA